MGLLADMTWGQWLLAVLIVGTCLFLILVILLQRGRGGGLAGAFGGGGGGAFGAKTGDVFTWITVAFATVFVLLAIVGNFVFVPSSVVVATPPEAQAPPGQPQTVTFPLEEGVDPEGMKFEMVTEDGQVIPIDGQVQEQPADGGTSAAPVGPPADAGEPPGEPQPDEDSGGGGSSGPGSP